MKTLAFLQIRGYLELHTQPSSAHQQSLCEYLCHTYFVHVLRWSLCRSKLPDPDVISKEFASEVFFFIGACVKIYPGTVLIGYTYSKSEITSDRVLSGTGALMGDVLYSCRFHRESGMLGNVFL